MTISRDIKIDIFDVIKSQVNAFGVGNDPEILLEFINDIWQLKRMPSTDSRYSDAEGDFIQHMIRNDDWDIDHIFLSRLNLIEDDDKFILFIENLLSAKYKVNSDEIIKFVLMIDPYLEKAGLKLAIEEYDLKGAPIYKIYEKTKVDLLPVKTKQNNISFYFQEHAPGRGDIGNLHKPPPVFPAFVLTFNEGWNDYSYRTIFYLFFYDADKVRNYVGQTKIIRNDAEFTTIIPNEFTKLEDDFCSMGQTISYYQDLKALLGHNLESVLFALRDVAFFPKILESFERLEKYKLSIIRSDRVERLVREARFLLYDFDLTKLYQFKYNFHPAYATEAINVNFDFDYAEKISNRIIALIGKNGTGKTQLLTSLPLKISKKEDQFFTPNTPKFSKVIAISYSIFDRFEIPKPTADFNYVHCGFTNSGGHLKTREEFEKQFLVTWATIHQNGRLKRWHQVLRNFMDNDIISKLNIINFKDDKGLDRWRVNSEGYHEIKKILSSGQNILLYIISEITANLRYDSLVLYDEPETHLHPNAITQLISSVHGLIEEFESFCIIATHSPLVIRELPSKSVFIIEKFENTPTVRKIGLESFGGNLGTLTEDVFGNREITKTHELIVEDLVQQKYTYDQIIEILQTEDIPVNLNVRLYAKSLLKERQ